MEYGIAESEILPLARPKMDNGNIRSTQSMHHSAATLATINTPFSAYFPWPGIKTFPQSIYFAPFQKPHKRSGK